MAMDGGSIKWLMWMRKGPDGNMASIANEDSLCVCFFFEESVMKHKKDKKDKKEKTGMLQHRQRPQASTSAAASTASADSMPSSAYRWEKLSPAEFEQLQDLSACKFSTFTAGVEKSVRKSYW